MSEKQFLDVFQGENRTLTLYARDQNNNPYDLTGTNPVWRVGRSPWGGNTGALIEKSGTVVNGPAGIFTVTLEPSDTLSLRGNFFHVSLVATDGEIVFQNNGSSGAPPAVTFASDTLLDAATFTVGASVTAFSTFFWVQFDPAAVQALVIPDASGLGQVLVNISADGGGTWTIEVAVIVTDGSGSNFVAVQFSGVSYDFTAWTPGLLSVDWSNFSSIGFALYLGDTLVTGGMASTGGSGGPMWGDMTEWKFGANESGGSDLNNYSTFAFYPTSLLDGTGLAISSANRRQFTDASNNWINPGGFPAGSVMLFNGDASSYATNQGTGGPFTVQGTPLVNAPTAPPGGGGGGARQDIEWVNNDGDEIIFVNDYDGDIDVVTAGTLAIRRSVRQ